MPLKQAAPRRSLNIRRRNMQRITSITPTLKPKPADTTVTVRTREAFNSVMATAPRGTRIAYHVGFLLVDRDPPYDNMGRFLPESEENRTKRKELARFANFIYKQYETGAVVLVQRRLSHPLGCEYLAVKR